MGSALQRTAEPGKHYEKRTIAAVNADPMASLGRTVKAGGYEDIHNHGCPVGVFLRRDHIH